MTESLLKVMAIVLMALSLIATLPVWPYSKTWDYYACSLVVVLLVLLFMLMLLDRI